MVDVAGVGRVDDGAGAEKEQGLEEGVVPDVQQGAAQAEDDPVRPAQRSPEQGQAEAHDDDADVLDTVVGQEALQVVLADGEGDAKDAGNRAQPQDGPTPFHRRIREQGGHPHQAVNAHLDEDARHDGGNMAGRGRVGAGQPNVQRHDAGLQTEADERQDEDGRRQSRRQVVWIHGNQRERAVRAGPAQQGEEGEQAKGRRVGGHQVEPAGFADILLLVFRGDQEEGRQRHDLPAEQEQDAVARDRQQGHAGGHRAVEQTQLAPVLRVFRLLPVGQPVDVAQERDQEDRQQKDGRQPVHGHAELGAGNDGPRQTNRITVSRCPEPSDARQAERRPEHRQRRGHPLSRHRRPAHEKARNTARSGDNDPPEHQRFAHDVAHHVRKDTQARARTTMSTM